MSSETPEVSNPNTEESLQQPNDTDRRLEDAGATPVPCTFLSEDDKKETDFAPAGGSQEPSAAMPEVTCSAPRADPPVTAADDQAFAFTSGQDGRGQPQPPPPPQQQQLPLSLNKLAIFASSQNKLPVSKVKSVVVRLGRPTESSSHKTCRWYKNDNYVDKDSYTWRNMPLFEDHQRHLWTSEGTVRSSCKK